MSDIMNAPTKPAAVSEKADRFGEVIRPPESDPIKSLGLFFRGRVKKLFFLAAILSPALAYGGLQMGTKTYQSNAIVRIYPQEKNILYANTDSSVLKTFDTYVKAETTYLASFPVMELALSRLNERFPVMTEEVNENDLAGSIEIKRRDSLIVLTAMSKDPVFAQAKLHEVTSAYLDLQKRSRVERSNLRLQELAEREQELVDQLDEIDAQTLEVGGEYDLVSLARAHLEKISQIDRISTRRAEVQQTLQTIMSNDGTSSADMNDQEIIRATLLDRALADLNFEKSKKEAELDALLLRYPEHAPVVVAKKTEVRVLDDAMADRREQIKVLGQTGALTDTSKESSEISVDEITALLNKVTGQLDSARAEAKQLNEKRIKLITLSEERAEVRDLLDETRKVLDEIRVESANILPSLSVLMSPATLPPEAAEDSSKILAAAGFGGGGFLALVIIILAAILRPGIRYSDEAWKLRPFFQTVKAISKRDMHKPVRKIRAFNAVRNALMLFPARMERFQGQGRVILVTKLASGSSAEEARELAAAFDRAKLRTLLIDADVRGSEISGRAPKDEGFFDHLSRVEEDDETDFSSIHGVLTCGTKDVRDDSSVSLKSIRKLLVKLSRENDVLIVNGGSVEDTLTARLLLASCELCLSVVHQRDDIAKIGAWADDAHHLPKNGSAFLLSGGRVDDPNTL